MGGGAGRRCGRSASARRAGAVVGLVLVAPLGIPGLTGSPKAYAATVAAESIPTVEPSPAAGSSPAAEPAGRYYVVGPGTAGQKEYLYGIAVQTLGDGNRFREIIELNRDRPQPDGGRLTDPLDLRPGWILLLPPDAKGAGVQVGTPPDVPARASASAAEPVRVPAPDAASDRTRTSFAGYLLRLGAFGLMVLLLAVAVAAIRQRRRSPVTVASTATAAPAPEAEADRVGEPGELRAELGQGPDRVEVRLIGAGRVGDVGAYAWLPDGDRLPGATMPVVLGRQAQRWLWVDLARTPDLLTVTGTPEASGRQALAIVGQLLDRGIGVTVVGRVLGDDVPAGCRQVDAFPAAPYDADGPGIVISGGLRGADLLAARGMLAASDGLLVPVLVGKVLRARWSLLAVERPTAPPSTGPGTAPASTDAVSASTSGTAIVAAVPGERD
ncbi:LysM peptidoglycan-binding domain-containing protein [Micromonospora sp. NPDC004704]